MAKQPKQKKKRRWQRINSVYCRGPHRTLWKCPYRKWIKVKKTGAFPQRCEECKKVRHRLITHKKYMRRRRWKEGWRPKRPFYEARNAAIKALADQGLSRAEIGRRVGCHRQHVVRVLRRIREKEEEYVLT